MTKFEPLNETEHILSFKKVIEYLRKNASVAFVSVREKKLSELLDDCNVNYKYRGPIYDYLKKKGLLIVQGERALMRYKFVESLMKVDALTQANMAYEEISAKIKPQKHRIKRNTIPAEKIVLGTISVTTKEFALRDTVAFLMGNKIVQGQIVGSQYAYKDKIVSENETVSEIDFSTTLYNLIITSIIPEKGTIIKDMDKGDIFSSIDILLQALKIRYANSISKVRTE